MSDLVPHQAPAAGRIQVMSLHGDIRKAVQGLGWEWCIEETCATYLATQAVQLPTAQAEALLAAANTLYTMFVDAVPDDLPDSFLAELAIPANLWAAVRHSWHDDRHWHLYGRFDLAYTPDGPKLIEFNADTASAIPETGILQWAGLAAAGFTEAEQCAALFEGLVAQFEIWREQNNDLQPSLLLVYAAESPEDSTNCEVVAEAAKEAGFRALLKPVSQINISVASGERGVWAQNEEGQWEQFPFLFKLVPWEQIAWYEPDMAALLTNLLQTRSVVVANPAYTLIFQSKAMLAKLWQRYPYHPLLVPASLSAIEGRAVQKPFFGREGQNIAMQYPGGLSLKTEGEYDAQPQVYQQFVSLPEDDEGRLYQAGVFWAGEACAIGFRREKGIITNVSQFVPHLLV